MNFTDELLRVKVASHRRPFPLDAAMFLASASVAALPSLALWQTALVIAPALVFAGAALWATQTHTAWRVARVSAALALALAALAAAALIGNSSVSGAGQAFGVRSDPVGAVVGLFVAFVGWVIVRYSEPYLDGERHEGSYVAWLLATLAAVMLVVATNHLLVLALAWSASSLALHRLLTFFRERPAAVLAAHKKFLMGRMADACMLAVTALLYLAFDTLRIDLLLERAGAASALPIAAQAAVVLIAIAALLKCAQLPFHGWLIQVMEAPTPVSALLHAGIVNLGGFVLLRFAPLVAEVPLAVGLLVVVGAFTAVVAGLVMTTRISVTVALAWSTCAQMGFMLMQCGLGLWEMALLHLVAHSLYKAHTFLSAGGVVRAVLVRELAPAPQAPGLTGLLMSAAIGLAMSAAAATAYGIRFDAQPALWVMGGVLALALTPLLHARSNSGGLLRWGGSALSALALCAVYFGLHALLVGWVAPASAAPAGPWWLVVALAFALLFAIQCAVASRPAGALARGLYPWLYGGLFLDERFSRFLFRHWPPPLGERTRSVVTALPIGARP